MDQFLDRQVFMNILQYEEQMMYGQFNKEIVENLINLYAQCVEYYDSLRDPIKFYFLEKMQIILSHEQTLKEIITPKNAQQSRKITPKNQVIEDKNIIIDNFEDECSSEQPTSNNIDPQSCMNFSEIIQQSQYRENFNGNNYNDDESDYYDLDSIQGEEQDYKNANSNRLTMQQMKQKYKSTYKGFHIYMMKSLNNQQVFKYTNTNAQFNLKQQVKYSISKKRLERSKRVGMYLQIHQESNTTQADTMGSLYQSYVDNNEKQANSVKQNLNLQQQEVERRLQRRRTLKEGGQNNILVEKSKQIVDKNSNTQQVKKEQSKIEQDTENQDPEN